MIVEGRESSGEFSTRCPRTSITSYPGVMRSVGMVVALACALAACESGGMEILVFGPSDPGTPPPKTVRLFIGLGASMPSTLFPAFGGKTGATAPRWDRDPSNTDDVADYVGDGPARFVFRPGGGITGFGVVIAVGFDADGVTPTSSAVLLAPEMGNAHIKAYTIGLNKITSPAQAQDGYNGLVLWGPASTKETIDPQCVLAQNTYYQPMSTSAFIVTPGDRDCDGFPDPSQDLPSPLECDANAWRGARLPRLTDASCLLDAIPSIDHGPACLLGGPACTDGIGPDGTCQATRFCGYPTLCENTVCGVINPEAWECAKDARLANVNNQTYPRLKCSVTAIPNPMGAGLMLCPDTNPAGQRFDLHALGLPAGATCSHVYVRDTTRPFGDHLVDGMAQYNIAFDSACHFEVTGQNGYAITPPAPPIVSGLLAVDLQSTFHGMAIPIEFHVNASGAPGQCAPSTCQFVGTPAPALLDCLQAPPP